MNKTIGIITCNHGREKVLQLWCAQIARLRNEMDMYIPAVCVSGIEDMITCLKYGVMHHPSENFPVSEKFNKGMEYAREIGWDYVCIMGSDDVMSTDTFKCIYEEAQSPNNYDLIGIDSIYFYGTVGEHKGKLVKLNHGKMLGVAKCISSRVLEKVDYRPWNVNKNYGLDAIASQCIAPHIKSWKILQDTFVCDIKSNQNINKMSVFARRYEALDVNLLMNILGEEEKEILKSI